MGNREKEVREGLGEKAVTIRQTGMDGIKLWSGNLRLGRERGDRKNRGKIFKMNVRDRKVDSRIYSKGGITEGKTEV